MFFRVHLKPISMSLMTCVMLANARTAKNVFRTAPQASVFAKKASQVMFVFVCSCLFTNLILGRNCEFPIDPCDEMENTCGPKGECEPDDKEQFVCHCLLGFRGKFCDLADENLQISQLETVKMNGNSFLSFDNSFVTQSEPNKQQYNLEIRTNQ